MAGGQHGGAEIAFVDMCIAMHEAGETIEVITRPNDIRVPRLRSAGLKVHTLPFGGKIDLYTRWAIRKIINKFQPSIIQCWMSRAANFVPRYSSSMQCPPYITVGRMGTPYKLKYYKNIDYFVSITPDIVEHIANNGIERTHIRQINNFAEVEPVDVPLNRADYGTPDDAPLLLGLGRLHWDKAFDTLITVASEMPDVHVWIAGEGADRAKLETQIKDLGLENRVQLLGWRNDRAALFQAADICAFISRDEGFGTVFVQSWAQGTPLVASNCDGPRQFVKDGEDGLIAPIDDVQAIKAALRRVIDDKELREKLVKNGYERYEREFTKEASVRGYLDYYHHMLEQEGIAPR